MELLNYIYGARRYRTVVAYGTFFEDFLKEQEQKVQVKILQILRVIEEVEILPTNHLRHISGTYGLYEIRVTFGKRIFRVFCCFDAQKLVVLLSGFQKKTRKTPRKEIERALLIMREYYKDKE